MRKPGVEMEMASYDQGDKDDGENHDLQYAMKAIERGKVCNNPLYGVNLTAITMGNKKDDVDQDQQDAVKASGMTKDSEDESHFDKKRRKFYKQSSKTLIERNNNNAKCTLSFKKTRSLLLLSLLFIILWIVFLVSSIRSLKIFVEASPLAYMFISFQFVLIPCIFFERYFMVFDIRAAYFKSRITSPFFICILIVCIVYGFDLEPWHNNSNEHTNSKDIINVPNLGFCQVIDQVTLKTLKGSLLRKEEPPVAISPVFGNISVAVLDEIYYLAENLLDAYTTDNACATYTRPFIYSRLFRKCGINCQTITEYCANTCNDILSSCIENYHENMNLDGNEEFEDMMKTLQAPPSNTVVTTVTGLIVSQMGSTATENDVRAVLKETVNSLKTLHTYLKHYTDPNIRRCSSSNQSFSTINPAPCLNIKNYSILGDDQSGACSKVNLTKSVLPPQQENMQISVMPPKCEKNCFYIVLCAVAVSISAILAIYVSYNNVMTTRFRQHTFVECAITLTERGKALCAGLIPIFVSTVMYQHGLSVEKHFQNDAFTPIMSYLMGCIGYYQGALSLLPCFTGFSIVQLDNDYHVKVSKSKKSKTPLFLRTLYRWYISLFSFTRGRYIYEKIFLYEIVEIVLQYNAFVELCKSANITYIVMSYTLLLLNVLVSPTIMLCKKKNEVTHKSALKYVIYVFDSTLDALYLFTNIYRGGDANSKPKLEFTVNAALWYPSLSIIKKMRVIRRTITKTSETKYSTRTLRFRHHDILHHAKSAISKECKHRVETFVLLSVLSIGAILLGSNVINFLVKYMSCRNEFTIDLWEGASPIKMYSYGLWNITCGYHLIKSITADNKHINYIPKIINKCTKLERLSLSDNNLTALPCELLEMTNIKYANLNGNPVASKLEIRPHDCKLKGKIFPTENFVCKHMHQTLKHIIFPNQNITKVSRCIHKFEHLESLILPHNQLAANGIPSTILDLSNVTLAKLVLDVRGNTKINKDFSWQDESINNKQDKNDLTRLEKMTSFLIKHFPDLRSLNLAGNSIREETVMYQLLDNMPMLKLINMSMNDLYEIDKERKRFYTPFSSSIWSKLQVIDLASNPLKKLSLDFCLFIEMRGISLNIKKNTINLVSWGYKNDTEFSLYNSKHYSLMPMTIMKQLYSLKVLRIFPHSGLTFTSTDLKLLCQYTNVEDLELSGRGIKLSYVPEACKAVQIFKVDIGGGAGAIFNFSWPSMFGKYAFSEFTCAPCGLTNVAPIVNVTTSTTKLKQLNIGYNSGLKVPFVSLLSYFELPTLVVMILTASPLVGEVNLAPHVYKKLQCLDLASITTLSPLMTPGLYNINGELYIHKNVSNLDYLLQNATENITKDNISIGAAVVTQTTWKIQSMVCRDQIDRRDKNNIVCLAPEISYKDMC